MCWTVTNIKTRPITLQPPPPFILLFMGSLHDGYVRSLETYHLACVKCLCTSKVILNLPRPLDLWHCNIPAIKKIPAARLNRWTCVYRTVIKRNQCVALQVITRTTTAALQDLYSCKPKREIITSGKFKYFQQDQRVEQRSVPHYRSSSGRAAWVIEMCNNCDRGRYLTHFFFFCLLLPLTLLCLYTSSLLHVMILGQIYQSASTLTPHPPPPTHSVTSQAKGFFLTTRMWPHFICMSPHQSGQRPSSPRSLPLPDSCSHWSDKAQTRRPSNCLIGFSQRSFFDLVQRGWHASDLIDMHPHLLSCQWLLTQKGSTLVYWIFSWKCAWNLSV